MPAGTTCERLHTLLAREQSFAELVQETGLHVCWEERVAWFNPGVSYVARSQRNRHGHVGMRHGGWWRSSPLVIPLAQSTVASRHWPSMSSSGALAFGAVVWPTAVLMVLDPLDQGAGAGAAGGAHRHESELRVGAFELVQQRRDQACTR